MEIAQLGEFGLIKHLTKDLEKKNESTRMGVGAEAERKENKIKNPALFRAG